MRKIIFIIIPVILAIGVGAYFLFFNKPKEEEPEIIKYNYPIEEPFITNVKDSQRLFKTSIILVLNKDKMDEVLTEEIYIIRDTILMILRELTEEEISGMDIQDRLRSEISASLNTVLGIDNIVSVYFSDFVMQ